MKSALVALAMLLIATSAFAVDFSAAVYMEGSVWGTDGFRLADATQDDPDLIEFSVSTDVAGASGRLKTNTEDMNAVKVRYLRVWFKPVSALKVIIGKVDSGLYTEQLDWWRVPTAAIDVGKQSDAGAAGQGVSIELTPVEGVTIAAGIAPGVYNDTTKHSWLADCDPFTTGVQLGLTPDSQWGVTAKFKLGTIGSAGLAYRFDGASTTSVDGAFTCETQLIRAGMDFTMVPGLYAFVTGIANIDAGALRGVAIDNYVAYTAGALTVKAAFPVVIRLDADGVDNVADTADDDSGYMSYDVKVSYKVLDNVSPYFRITAWEGLTADYARSIDFDDIKFAPSLQLGADYSFGKASLGTSLKVDIPANDTNEDLPITWSIPFWCRVSF
jgi:hypothetical protein